LTGHIGRLPPKYWYRAWLKKIKLAYWSTKNSRGIKENIIINKN
jgi:hypothetical protein